MAHLFSGYKTVNLAYMKAAHEESLEYIVVKVKSFHVFCRFDKNMIASVAKSEGHTILKLHTL